MDIVDSILNIAGVLLWINWVIALRSPGLNRANTLLGTLRRTDQRSGRHWLLLIALPLLLVVRAWLYWEIAGGTTWVASLDLGVLSLPFRCDFFERALAFSALSFTVSLVLFYAALILLSTLSRQVPESDPLGRFVRLMLGPMARWPAVLQLFMPLIVGTLFWMATSLVFGRMQLVPPPQSELERLEQGALIGLSAYLSWPHIIAVILLLYLIHSYVHLGDHPIWSFINSVSRTLLHPIRQLPVHVGRIDLSPLLLLGLLYLLARGARSLLHVLEQKLPI